ncbi:LamG-like jellyroll fold domain-containing protein [Paenibacillus mendelii]|uniref:LamG-like jellyroll fold domain-containing protein n=1 Tax=Paenibacillus mendelii TaxID=206163 RepID=A0ABV6J2R1_9BACL|nr:LamG-like jellyroll fold domain-containing protein [Paenibacillus mendelii]MCQ6559271.1 hypothetical protein [Paenibacillus mendelii]
MSAVHQRKWITYVMIVSLVIWMLPANQGISAVEASAEVPEAAAAPPFVISSFEQDLEGWTAGENVAELTRVDSFKNGPFKPRRGTYALDASFVPGLNTNQWRSIHKTFDQPVDLSYRPIIAADFNSWGTAWLGGQENYVRIRVYSGDQVKDSGEIVYTPDQWNSIHFDMTGWAYLHAIDKIEVMYRASLDLVDSRWDEAHMQIDQVMAVSDPATVDFPSPDYTAGYSFDAAVGATMFDDSGSGLDAVHTYNGADTAPQLVPGKLGSAIALDGSASDYVRIPDGLTQRLNGDFAFTGWVKPAAALQQGAEVFSFEAEDGSFMELSTAANGALAFMLRKTDGNQTDSISGGALEPGRWNHIAVTMTVGQAKLYVDGAEAASGDGFVLRPSDIGAAADSRLGQDLNGQLDEFRFYSHSLSADQIADMSMFSLYYKFNDGRGTTAKDASKFKLHAELIGGATFGVGAKGGAVVLSGKNQYVQLPQGIIESLAGKYTFSAGVRLDDKGSGGDKLFSFSSGSGQLSLSLTGSGDGPVFTIESGGQQDVIRANNAAVRLGEWTHVAVTVDGNVGVLYLNGTAVGSNNQMTLSPRSLGTQAEGVIGKSDRSSFMKGRVDEFRVYDTTLTAETIAAQAAEFHKQDRSPQIPITNANWSATDALGRKLPTYEEVGPTREGKYVGVFYYIWHGTHGNQIYDNTKILAANPTDPQYGPMHAFHFWGEPEAGYYQADDPWVIRRNLHMLSNAGVDFIYFDVTNAFTYLDVVAQLADVSMQMREEGIQTPYLVFTTSSSSGAVVNELYDKLYSKELYKDLWFIWDGKPLIMGNIADPALSQTAKDFFTFRYSWAWTDAKNQPDHWQWVDEYPQDYGWHEDPSVPEQVAVAAASHPMNNIGQSYQNGAQPDYDPLTRLTPYTGQGRHLAEQWNRALEVDPEVVMVTQWNEWVAQRFIIDQSTLGIEFLGKRLNIGDSYFVDDYNEEYNRDIEPMKDGHTDNNYYQLVSYIRKFKGMEAPPQPGSGEKEKINIDGKFKDWKNVGTVFTDPAGDTLHRDWKGYDPTTQYTNATGRNDIVESRIAYHDNDVFFYAQTADPLTPHTDPNWMQLFIDTDQSKETGWEGYDFAVNLDVISDKKTRISQYKNGAWTDAGTADYRYVGNELEIRLPRKLLGQKSGNKPLALQFHWADNMQKQGDITEFFLNGDSAPDRRANFQVGDPIQGEGGNHH